MPHVTISVVEKEENGAEMTISYTFSFSRLNEKVDNFLLCFFIEEKKNVG